AVPRSPRRPRVRGGLRPGAGGGLAGPGMCGLGARERVGGLTDARLDLERHRIRGLRCDAMRKRLRANLGGRWLARTQRLIEAGEDRLDANEAIGLDVDIGSLLAVAQAARRVVHLYRAGLRAVLPSTDVVGQAGANGENDVSGLEQFHSQRSDVAAGAADSEFVVVKQAARRKRVGEHGTTTVGQLQHGLPRASTQDAATTEDDRPLG